MNNSFFSLFWFNRRLNTVTYYLFDMNILRCDIYLLNLRSMFVSQMISFWQWYSMPWLLYFYKLLALENCCTLLYFLAPQWALWIAWDGGGSGEVKFYKPKNNIKDNITCLFLLLVSSNINDIVSMQPC